MAEVFHVAARRDRHLMSHAAGTVLGYQHPVVTTYPGAHAAISARFPGGVSSHGAQYLASWPGDQPAWATEAVFEAVRLAEHPDKPSRLTSWFAGESLEDARAFVASYRSAVYVDIWRADAEIVHRANMGLLGAVGVPVIAALERASAYWRGERGPAAAMWEVLTAPGMRLLEVVETTGIPVAA
jgi:hypothetical protein